MKRPIHLKVLADQLGWLLVAAVCLAAYGCTKSAGPPKVEKLPVKGVMTLDTTGRFITAARRYMPGSLRFLGDRRARP